MRETSSAQRRKTSSNKVFNMYPDYRDEFWSEMVIAHEMSVTWSKYIKWETPVVSYSKFCCHLTAKKLEKKDRGEKIKLLKQDWKGDVLILFVTMKKR